MKYLLDDSEWTGCAIALGRKYIRGRFLFISQNEPFVELGNARLSPKRPESIQNGSSAATAATAAGAEAFN